VRTVLLSILLLVALPVMGQERSGRTPAKRLPMPEQKQVLIPSRAEVTVAQARQLVEQGKRTDGKRMLMRLDTLGSLNAADHLLLSTLHYQSGEFKWASEQATLALGLFNTEIQKQPLQPAPYLNTGVCYLIMNDLAKAEVEFVKFLNRTKESERGEAVAGLKSLALQGINKPDVDYVLRKHFPETESAKPAAPATADVSRDVTAPVIVVLSPEATRGLQIIEALSYKAEVVGLASDDVGVSVVRINSIPATLMEATGEEAVRSGLSGKVVKFTAEVMLAIGDNQVEIQALDVAGNSARRVFTMKRRPEEVAKKADGKLPTIWAVIVGISRYQDKSLELRFANKDAQSFYGFLKSPGGGAVPDKQIDLLLDRNATRADIIQSINAKLRLAFDDDEVIIYIACHGIPDEVSGELYFLGYDADVKNIPGTGISQSDIQKAIVTARAKKVVVIADACHSGSIELNPNIAARGNAAYLTNKLLQGLTEVRSGIAMLTASSASEFSREGEEWDGHGVFTYHLVQGLNGPADKNNDGLITIRELYEYVYRTVADATNGSQHPDLQGRFDNQWPLGVVR